MHEVGFLLFFSNENKIEIKIVFSLKRSASIVNITLYFELVD